MIGLCGTQDLTYVDFRLPGDHRYGLGVCSGREWNSKEGKHIFLRGRKKRSCDETNRLDRSASSGIFPHSQTNGDDLG